MYADPISNPIKSIRDNQDTLRRAESAGIMDFKSILRLRQKATSKEGIDRRLFDYTKLLMGVLASEDRKIALFLNVASENNKVWNYPIMHADEFTENLEKLVAQYCD